VPGAKPRLITDNGPQFVARDFRQFVRICGMTHVRTSPGSAHASDTRPPWAKSGRRAALAVDDWNTRGIPSGISTLSSAAQVRASPCVGILRFRPLDEFAPLGAIARCQTSRSRSIVAIAPLVTLGPTVPRRKRAARRHHAMGRLRTARPDHGAARPDHELLGRITGLLGQITSCSARSRAARV